MLLTSSYLFFLSYAYIIYSISNSKFEFFEVQLFASNGQDFFCCVNFTCLVVLASCFSSFLFPGGWRDLGLLGLSLALLFL
jgi:hypothetical protein